MRIYQEFYSVIEKPFFTPVQLGLSAFWSASVVILAILGTLAYFEWAIWK
ncbi:MAG: hypothetical protein Q8P07_00160 [bacterium]|nr:hypothetical protein [bacterium]